MTRDAFERIVGEMTTRLAQAGPVDGVYLDLHGAMVTEHLDDGEGEILARVRRIVGPRVPVIASLDLHANVTRAMMEHADGLVAYRTYPHIDMAATGTRAAELLARTLAAGRPLAKAMRPLDFLTGLSSQSTFIEPGRRLYDELERLEREHDVVLSFTPGFPMADFPECQMAVFGYGPDPARVRARGRRARARGARRRARVRARPLRPRRSRRARDAARRASARRSCWPTRRTTRARAATATRRACWRRCWTATRATRCWAC